MTENEKDWDNPAFRRIYIALAAADQLTKDDAIVRWLNRNGFCNLTVCPECRVDDFVDVEGCSVAARIERARRRRGASQ